MTKPTTESIIVVGKTIVLVPYTSRQLIGKVVDFKEGRYHVQFKGRNSDKVVRTYLERTLKVLSHKGLKKHKQNHHLTVDFS